MKPWVPLLVLLFVLFGCDLFRSSHIGPKNINDAIALWDSKKPSAYSIQESFTCNCTPPTNYRITVASGKITGIYDIKTDSALNPDSIKDKLYKTVDGMFNWLKAQQALNPYKLQMYFDINYGFPTEVYFDPNEKVVGDEIVFTMTDFTPTN